MGMIAKIAVLGGMTVWLCYIGLFLHYDATRPTKVGVGRVIPQNNHGHIVYLNEQEQKRLLEAQYSSAGLFIISAIAFYLVKRTEPK